WNSVRSKGLGGNSLPIWFCAERPHTGATLPSLGGRAEVLVYVDSASLAGAGEQALISISSRSQSDRIPSSSRSHPTADPRDPTALRRALAGVDVFELIPTAGEGEGEEGGALVESLASTGDERGAIGAWHLEKAINAKDGSELMSVEEAKPLREARQRELAMRAQKVAAAAAAKEEKKRLKALEEERRIALEAAAQPKVERYNPYLAHQEEGFTTVKKAHNRTAE
ncbi:MAG: hypothetical protein SGPRY_011619, partial [Prymnesium sp.]